DTPERTALPGSDCRVKCRVGRDHHDHRLRIHFQKLFECAESADTRHGNVKEDYIEGAASVSFQTFFTGLCKVDAITFGGKKCLQHFSHDLFIIDNKHLTLFNGTFISLHYFRTNPSIPLCVS